MSPDNTAPISSIRQQHVSTPTATYFYNLLPFSIKINRFVEGLHKSMGAGMTGAYGVERKGQCTLACYFLNIPLICVQYARKLELLYQEA